MNAVRQYILSVIVGGMICGIVHNLSEKLTTSQSAIRTLANTIFLIILISPITGFNIPEIFEYSDSFANEAGQYVSEGEAAANYAAGQIIKERSQSYILDKAATLNVAIDVEVILNDKQLEPQAVILTGSVSPYVKQQLEYFIKSQLGISGEYLQWK